MNTEELQFGERREKLSRMKKKSVWKWALAAVAVVGIALAVIVPQVSAQRKAKALQEQLDLGAKYLDELNYEQALDAYQAAVEIDETCAEAYVGESYAYEGLEDVEAAIDILLTAGENLQDEQIGVRMEELFDGQLAEGQDALSSSHFEEARKSYRLARKIHPEGEALRGLVDVYVRWVNNLAEKSDYEQALAILEEGIEETDAEELKSLREQLQEEKKEYEEEQERIALVQPLMEEIAGYIQAEDYAAVSECQSRSEYKDYVAGSEDGAVFDTAYGKLGIYGEYLYLGDYAGGQREGNGIWLFVDSDGYWVAKGQWSGDMPNGNQRLEYDYGYSQYMEGTVQKGVWSGEVLYEGYFRHIDTGGYGYHSWMLYAENGRWRTYGTGERGGVIVSEKEVSGEATTFELESVDDRIAVFGFEQ